MKPLTGLKADSVDGVIRSLERVIEWSIANANRSGYFAALYRKVTLNVKQGIEDGYFEDGERMRRLDVNFAYRYLHAFEGYFAGKPITKSWKLAFDLTEKRYPLVMQHLLISLNAHINLDLGLAVVETVSAEDLPKLRPDFEKINDLLAGLLNEVQQELATIWPMLRWLERITGGKEDALIDEGLKVTRNDAWRFALASADPAGREKTADRRDSELAVLGEAFMDIDYLTWPLFFLIRLSERGNIVAKIEALR